MAKLGDLFPSRFLKGTELGKKRVTVVIESLTMEEMPDGVEKPVLWFKKAKKGLVLNVTNANIISEAYGDETDGWKGKPIVIFFDPSISFGGKRTGGLRVMVPEGDAADPAEEEMEEEIPVPDDSEEPCPF